MSAFGGNLALLHTCGPEAVRTSDRQLQFETDLFTAWAACGPDLKAVLKHDGELIVCPNLARAILQQYDLSIQSKAY